eukprot:CAMPEP_0202900852 /NCGR_PEP_ID=MMETSP1392-20130828/12071_1 /ASSEMBLY_ACC=CAM_ASM_000868 /TAXON_ID=225041 /ORGANISM="Chlamydomonas chlamydogama, Strain SAG 11-48b" /LENGTH=784 /DNA_ID=CAMNT_0049587305 /DNA_START=364 /DNA_END=2719 /DNA_ORIENTATION=+
MGRAFSLVPLVACSVLLVQLCGAFGELGVHGKEAEKQDSDFGLLVDDLLSERPSGVQVLYQGAPFEDFERPLPRFVEQSAGQDFEVYLNQTQDFHPNGDNTYLADGQQFVVSIKNGRVSGVLGAVFDNRGRIFTELTPSVAGLPTTKEQLDATKCKHFKRLATTIQKYGQMYYHFIQEVIPRIILLRPFLNEETKVLTFGAPYEAAWLQYLGIPPEHMEVYDPTATYCADELLVPSPSAVIIPPKENYGLLRKVFKADPPLPVEQRDLIIYCSRKGASDRRVRNEDEILAAVAARFPNEKVQIFTGKESVSETVQIFKRAKIVIGMHGAGLSHSVFSAPGTALIEFLFMYNPPMMFWHAAAASGQRYFMVPLAQSWWLAPEAEIPTADVLDVLSLALDVPAGDCPLGHVKDAQTSKCVPCPAGTYRAAGASLCTPCAGGRIAADAGAAFCRTCPVNTFSDESRTQCVACSGDANTMFPGSPSEDSCHPVDELEYALDVMFDNENLAKKLVRLPALELPKPTSTLGWVSSLVSPKRMLRAHHMNQLRNQLLEDLFDADGLEQSDEDLEEGEEEHGEGGASRSLLQYQTRRLLQYDGDAAAACCSMMENAAGHCYSMMVRGADLSCSTMVRGADLSCSTMVSAAAAPCCSTMVRGAGPFYSTMVRGAGLCCSTTVSAAAAACCSTTESAGGHCCSTTARGAGPFCSMMASAAAGPFCSTMVNGAAACCNTMERGAAGHSCSMMVSAAAVFSSMMVRGADLCCSMMASAAAAACCSTTVSAAALCCH